MYTIARSKINFCRREIGDEKIVVYERKNSCEFRSFVVIYILQT